MKNIDRRKFLYGAGGSMLALPWLEVVAAQGATTKLKEPSLRFASFYSPMGFVRDHFFPEKDSQDFLSMPTLSPLKKVGDKVSLITGLSRVNVRGVDVHNQCSSCYLSSADPHGQFKSAYPMDRTLDHLIADQVSHRTPIRSLGSETWECNKDFMGVPRSGILRHQAKSFHRVLAHKHFYQLIR
jgi:hypothetical protein